MNNFCTTEKDSRQAEKIRRQYLEKETDKMQQLKALDDKVKAPGKITASILGVIGALVMGSGMALVMEWGNMTSGLVLGIPGMLVAAAAYPVYTMITNSRKRKYAPEIIRISDEVTGR